MSVSPKFIFFFVLCCSLLLSPTPKKTIFCCSPGTDPTVRPNFFRNSRTLDAGMDRLPTVALPRCYGILADSCFCYPGDTDTMSAVIRGSLPNLLNTFQR